MTKDKLVLVWLIISAFLVFFMIGLGGLTRLTHSGLSMVEWQLFNIFPPLSEQGWAIEFNKYKNSPEFILVNSHIDLAGFKNIFWLEYLHRLLGRVIGLFVIVPVAYFYIRKQFQGKIWPILLVFLVALQGFLGWYMVSTGLVNNPNVAPYSLAMHLFCASVLYVIIAWQIYNYFPSLNNDIQNLKTLAIALLFLVFLQIIIGAFVAGLKAGLVYNEFPLMGSSFIPVELDYFSIKLLDDPVAMQFFHRMIAYVIIVFSFVVSYKIYKQGFRYLAVLIILVTILQAVLGVITLIYQIPAAIALVHQCGSILLLTVILFLTHKSTCFKQ